MIQKSKISCSKFFIKLQSPVQKSTFRKTVQHFYVKISPQKLDDRLEEMKLPINSHTEKDSSN